MARDGGDIISAYACGCWNVFYALRLELHVCRWHNRMMFGIE